ncbi:MAG: glycine zipper 2TM domain-containing protein [Sphingomonadales bacterium]
MTKKLLLAAAAVALAAPLGPAAADPPPWAPAHGYRAKHGGYGALYYPDPYYRPGRHYRDRVLTYRDRIYRGRDGRYYCRRSDGTTGLIIGGAIGALIGRELDRGRSRTVGTLVGAGTGALLGREIDRGRLRCD